MLRCTIKASPASDVDSLIDDLTQRARAAKLDSATVSLLIQNSRMVLTTLVDQGRALAANGSTMTVTRELSGPGFNLQILFGAERKRGWFTRLFGG